MKKFGFTMLAIYGIILAYGFLLPRPEISRPEIDRVVVNPLVPTTQDTFVVENPSWVKPMIIPHKVRVTVYYAVPAQTDDTPHILADGTRIDTTKAGSYRFCALSRDLLERWDGPYAYGDTIVLEGTGIFDGEWIVKDTMHKRKRKQIDLLVDKGTRPYSFDVAEIRKVI